MDRELTLRIILQKPTSRVDFGLQKGRGNNYETVQAQRSKGKDLLFECSVRVNKAKDSTPNFLGEFVQGPFGERFLYIDIGTYAGQTETCWSRRLKIPLREITWEQIDKASKGAASALQTCVPGVGKDGSPACATVKPFSGWVVA
jgi:hypothetical protein